MIPFFESLHSQLLGVYISSIIKAQRHTLLLETFVFTPSHIAITTFNTLIVCFPNITQPKTVYLMELVV